MRKTTPSRARRGAPEVPATNAAGDFACTSAALRRAARQLNNLYDDEIAPSGLKGTQFALLARIDRLTDEGGPSAGLGSGPSLQELAKDIGVQISAMTHALRPLVESGIVELATDLEDKRIKRATLSDQGRKRLQEGARLWAKANGRVEIVLGARTAALVRALADQISSDEFLAAYKAGRPLKVRAGKS